MPDDRRNRPGRGPRPGGNAAAPERLPARAPATAARAVAHQALVRIEREGAFANLVVPKAIEKLSERDRGFATELVYGTTRMRRALDFAVDRFLMRDPPEELRTILRLGAYQILYLRVPAHAAVGETVALAPPRLRGVTNAVLRKVAAGGPPRWPDTATYLSYPDWIVDRFVDELGEQEGLDALERMNEAPTVTVRDDGYVQDRSSQWVAELVEAQPGETVVDLCAAPGGKATALAATGAFVVAADLQAHRTGLIAQNAVRLGYTDRLAPVVADAAAPPLRPGCADRVLLDAPCSGLGALRRRPDARWRITAEAVDDLARLQRRLLAAARELVRPGGVLVYSVCTLTAAESIDLDDGSWEALPPPGGPWRPFGRGARVLPQDADTDGMTVLRWRRPA